MTTPAILEKHYKDFHKRLIGHKRSGSNEYLKELECLSTTLTLKHLRENRHGERVAFYDLFALYTERSNSFKMLYQVLLDEYTAIGLFSPDVYKKMRADAVAMIREKIERDEWHGKDNLKNRAEFRNKMMSFLREEIHRVSQESAKQNEPFAALCLSGGGIRSATFSLGVIQGLAAHGLLTRFHYLSTVSGGGYIGSWLSAWAARCAARPGEADADNGTARAEPPRTLGSEGIATVQRILATRTAERPEPPEVTHLRSYSNYMSPRTGLFSTDTWTLIAVYLRNLLLNWLVFIPFIAAVLLLPRIFETLLAMRFEVSTERALLIAAIASGLIGVAFVTLMRPSLEDYSFIKQRYRENDIGVIGSVEMKVFYFVFVWMIAFAVFLTTFWSVRTADHHLALSIELKNRFGTNSPLVFDCVALGLFLALGGYVLAWLFMIPRILIEYLETRRKAAEAGEDSPRLTPRRLAVIVSPYVYEFLILIACGTVGGLILFKISEIATSVLSSGGGGGVFPASPVAVGTMDGALGAVSLVPTLLLTLLIAGTFFVGLAVRITDDEDREWLARLGAMVLMFVVSWLVISAAVLFGGEIFSISIPGGMLAAVGGVSGVISLVFGFSAKSGGQTTDENAKGRTGLLMWFLPTVAAPVFVLFLIIVIATLTDLLIGRLPSLGYYNQTKWFGVLIVIGAVMGYFININKFSIHSIYRERLIRAYLGASRTVDRMRQANSFTGLDSENDNIEMRKLRHRPLHVVNMTLNLVKTQNLRWQNRKSESFTATPMYCGSSNMGEGSGNYRSAEVYGNNVKNGRSITLGTAAAISGAAASPNMGYFTLSSAVSFLMVLFNVRLGWWLGNPGRRGERTHRYAAPRWSPWLFLQESIGSTDDSKPYVYLSDGGHFENLGLYEMVLRRCSVIVLVDAGCDRDFGFSDLGKAIHKIRVDMGIRIEFPGVQTPVSGRNCAVGRIRYDLVDEGSAREGVLIYLKPTLDGDEPIDLKNYKKENPDFPHESTADQMYSENQFECYRSLGYHQIVSFCCGEGSECKCEGLSSLVWSARQYREKTPLANAT